MQYPAWDPAGPSYFCDMLSAIPLMPSNCTNLSISVRLWKGEFLEQCIFQFQLHQSGRSKKPFSRKNLHGERRGKDMSDIRHIDCGDFGDILECRLVTELYLHWEVVISTKLPGTTEVVRQICSIFSFWKWYESAIWSCTNCSNCVLL